MTLEIEHPARVAPELIDSAAIVADLQSLAENHSGHERELRTAVARRLKAALTDARTRAEELLLKDRRGRSCAERLSETQDEIIRILFDFAGIYHFKSRFRPRYEDRFICSLPKTTPMTGLALVRMSGMLSFSVKRAASNLIQKHFKRRQRAQLATHPASPLLGALPAE